jgi:hypothetical protein
VAQSKAPSSKVCLARGLTPPRARSASLEGSRPFERVPPRSRVPSSLERAPPRSRLPDERTYSHARVRAFKALTPRHHAPENHAPALFHQLPRGSPSPPLWGTVRRGRCQLRDTVPPTPVRLMHRALEGGPVAPSNPLLVTLQGQTVTSGRREHHPHRCQSCAAIPATAAPRRTLLQPLQRCWARGDGTLPRLPLYPVRITVNGFLEPAWRRPSQPLRLHPRSRPCSSTGHATAPRLEQGSPGRPPTPRHCTPYLHT